MECIKVSDFGLIVTLGSRKMKMFNKLIGELSIMKTKNMRHLKKCSTTVMCATNI